MGLRELKHIGIELECTYTKYKFITAYSFVVAV